MDKPRISIAHCITEDQPKTICCGCDDKFDGDREDAIEEGWQVRDNEIYCCDCIEAMEDIEGLGQDDKD